METLGPIDVLLAANVGLLILNGVLRWRAYRMWNRLRLLDRLLTQICINAVRRDHQPVWQAWANSMGRIQVNVSAERNDPD